MIKLRIKNEFIQLAKKVIQDAKDNCCVTDNVIAFEDMLKKYEELEAEQRVKAAARIREKRKINNLYARTYKEKSRFIENNY